MSIARACALTGRSRATHYRHTDPVGVALGPRHGPHRPRRLPPSTITDAERAEVLAMLNSETYRDLAIPQVWARELDEGRFWCSQSSMYRIARAAGQSRERRALRRQEDAAVDGRVHHQQARRHRHDPGLRRRAGQARDPGNSVHPARSPPPWAAGTWSARLSGPMPATRSWHRWTDVHRSALSRGRPDRRRRRLPRVRPGPVHYRRAPLRGRRRAVLLSCEENRPILTRRGGPG